MIKSIPFYASLIGQGTTTEILLYGLIENLSIKEGYCYASSKYLAEQLGVVPGTVKNSISKMAKKNWIVVSIDKSRNRVNIKPNLGLRPLPKSTKKPVEKPVEKSRGGVILQLHRCNSTITPVSFYDDTQNRGDNGGRNNIFNNKEYIKRKYIKEKESDVSVGLAGNKPADPNRPQRKNYKTTSEFVEACKKYRGGQTCGIENR